MPEQRAWTRHVWPAAFALQTVVLVLVWVRMSTLEAHLATALGDAAILAGVAEDRSLQADEAAEYLRDHYPAGTKFARWSKMSQLVEIVRELAQEVVACRSAQESG